MSLPGFIFDRVTADIRQQMANILALADQLTRQRLTPDAQACVVGVAEAANSVRRVMDAALDIRDIAGAGAGLVLAPSPVRLRELMDEIQEHCRPAADIGGVTLLISFDGDPEVNVSTDRARLLQIFHGFIGEAIAGARHGAVEASLRAIDESDGIRLEGRVRGARDAGWDAQALEARVREVDSRFGLEIALGLVLARRLVEELGGRLTEETNPGAGRTVVFELSLPRAAIPAPPPQSPGRSAHVLVVDDNATNRMVAQSLCEMFECTCEAAHDGVEAVDAARAGRFDLILMDIKMPRMDGVAATRAIRALPGDISRVPIVALTANADPDDVADYLAAGMDGVVEKPMKPEHLLAVLKQALDIADSQTAMA